MKSILKNANDFVKINERKLAIVLEHYDIFCDVLRKKNVEQYIRELKLAIKWAKEVSRED